MIHNKGISKVSRLHPLGTRFHCKLSNGFMYSSLIDKPVQIYNRDGQSAGGNPDVRTLVYRHTQPWQETFHIPE